MKTRTLGIVMCIAGILMITYSGFNYVTTEKVLDLGPIKINKEKNHFIGWPPLLGAVMIVSGIVIIAQNKKLHA